MTDKDDKKNTQTEVVLRPIAARYDVRQRRTRRSVSSGPEAAHLRIVSGSSIAAADIDDTIILITRIA